MPVLMQEKVAENAPVDADCELVAQLLEEGQLALHGTEFDRYRPAMVAAAAMFRVIARTQAQLKRRGAR